MEETKNTLVERLRTVDVATLDEREMQVLSDLNTIYKQKMGIRPDHQDDESFNLPAYIQRMKNKMQDEAQQQEDLQKRFM